jgi:uncharacterized membrane protein YbhN (UPF0104 family)
MRDRVAERMVELVRQDPKRLDCAKDNAAEALEKLRAEASKDVPAYVGDEWFYRIIVIGLIAVIVLTILSSIFHKGAVPDYIISLGSTAIGALAGLLVPTPGGRGSRFSPLK